MMKVKLFCLFFILSAISPIYAQINDFTSSMHHGYFYKPENLAVSSPQVSDFIKFGNLNMNHYNGLLDLNIDLEEYKDNDFHIPFSLQYVSNGFVPSKRPSIVGYNWILKGGGVISRVVHGSPDDLMGNYVPGEPGKYSPEGLLAAIRTGKFKEYSEEELLQFKMEKNDMGRQNPFHKGDFKHDFEPDVFHFSFGEYEGSFILGNDGNVRSLNRTDCRIDISGVAVQAYSTTAIPVNSTIKITTPDGYIYEFGGNNNYFEYSLPNNPAHAYVKPRYITSWFLKSIKAVNNREVTFSYDSRLQKIKYNSFLYAYDYIITLASHCNSTENPISSYQLAKHLVFEDKVYTPVLNTIKIDNTTIKFNTSKSASGFYDLSEESDKSYRLNSIECFYDNTSRKKINLKYLDKGRYFFLSSIEKNGSKHTFDYHLEQELPDPMTLSTDHWGFWSGGYETTTSNPPKYCNEIETNRAVNASYFNVALLNQVTYPTGGNTKIEYESHRYRHFFERAPGSMSAFQKTYAAPKISGGARVRSITDYDTEGSKKYNHRVFLYKSNLNASECGTIYIKPKYKLEEKIYSSDMFEDRVYNSQTGDYETVFCSKTVDRTSTNISANSLGMNPFPNEYYIHYPNVFEVFEDGSYIHYKYSSLLDTPDDEDVKLEILKPSTVTSRSFGDYQVAEKYNLYILNDRSRFRGKLLARVTYSADNKRKLSELYTYNTSEAKNQYNISVRSVAMGTTAYKMFTTECRLMKKNVIDENSISSSVSYEYNQYGFVNQEISQNSDGKESMNRYKYTGDYILSKTVSSGSRSELYNRALKRLADINAVGYIAEEQTLIRLNGSWKLTQGKLIEFGPFFDGKTRDSFFPKPKKEYILEANTPLDNIEESEVDTINKKFTFHSNYKEKVEYLKYDKNSYNPVNIVKDSMNIIYLWSYNNQYPVAEIRNATYAEIISVINQNALDAIGLQTQPSADQLAQINSLRTTLSSASVTTYTYKPLIGVETMTDPRGILTRYEYDAYGRLVKISRDGKLIEEYKYNHKQ